MPCKLGKNCGEGYGEDCFTERQCPRWFARFRSGNFSVQGAPHSGRTVITDDNQTKVSIETNRCGRTRGITEKPDISNSIQLSALTKASLYKQAGLCCFLLGFFVWVPHELSVLKVNVCILYK